MPVTPDVSLSRRRALSLGVLAVGGTALSACNKDTPTAPTTTRASGLPSVAAGSGSSTLPTGSASATSTATSTASASAKPVTYVTNLNDFVVTGAFNKAPTVKAPWPVGAKELLTKVLVQGTGAVLTATAKADVQYQGMNARTGETFGSSWQNGQSAVLSLDQVIAGFKKGLTGQKVGSRVLMLIPSAQAYDSASEENRPPNVLKGDSLVFIVDVLSTPLTAPSGTAQTPPADLPTVKDNGAKKVPTITIPAGAAKPTALKSFVLIKGTGPAVKDTDQITCNYVSMDWDTLEILAEDYTTGPEEGVLSTLVTAWKTALKGVPVGSRVLIVAPPATAYPKGNATPSISKTATQVYVVDVLFASAPQQ